MENQPPPDEPTTNLIGVTFGANVLPRPSARRSSILKRSIADFENYDAEDRMEMKRASKRISFAKNIFCQELLPDGQTQVFTAPVNSKSDTVNSSVSDSSAMSIEASMNMTTVAIDFNDESSSMDLQTQTQAIPSYDTGKRSLIDNSAMSIEPSMNVTTTADDLKDESSSMDLQTQTQTIPSCNTTKRSLIDNSAMSIDGSMNMTTAADDLKDESSMDLQTQTQAISCSDTVKSSLDDNSTMSIQCFMSKTTVADDLKDESSMDLQSQTQAIPCCDTVKSSLNDNSAMSIDGSMNMTTVADDFKDESSMDLQTQTQAITDGDVVTDSPKSDILIQEPPELITKTNSDTTTNEAVNSTQADDEVFTESSKADMDTQEPSEVATGSKIDSDAMIEATHVDMDIQEQTEFINTNNIDVDTIEESNKTEREIQEPSEFTNITKLESFSPNQSQLNMSSKSESESEIFELSSNDSEGPDFSKDSKMFYVEDSIYDICKMNSITEDDFIDDTFNQSIAVEADKTLMFFENEFDKRIQDLSEISEAEKTVRLSDGGHDHSYPLLFDSLRYLNAKSSRIIYAQLSEEKAMFNLMLESLALTISFGEVSRTFNGIPIRPIVKIQLDSNLRAKDGEAFMLDDFIHLNRYEANHKSLLKIGHDMTLNWFQEKKEELLKKHPHSDSLAMLVEEVAYQVTVSFKMVTELRNLADMFPFRFLNKIDDTYEIPGIRFCVELVLPINFKTYPFSNIRPRLCVQERDKRWYDPLAFKTLVTDKTKSGPLYAKRLIDATKEYISFQRAYLEKRCREKKIH